MYIEIYECICIYATHIWIEPPSNIFRSLLLLPRREGIVQDRAFLYVECHPSFWCCHCNCSRCTPRNHTIFRIERLILKLCILLLCCKHTHSYSQPETYRYIFVFIYMYIYGQAYENTHLHTHYQHQSVEKNQTYSQTTMNWRFCDQLYALPLRQHMNKFIYDFMLVSRIVYFAIFCCCNQITRNGDKYHHWYISSLTKWQWNYVKINYKFCFISEKSLWFWVEILCLNVFRSIIST